MDGAARFNQRDAMATILITAINIVAGFLIGVFQLNIQFVDALKTYTVLTVGDGLVTIIPSLLVSVAGGLVVTRTRADDSMGALVGQQLFSRSRPLVDRLRSHGDSGPDPGNAQRSHSSWPRERPGTGRAAWISRKPGRAGDSQARRPGKPGFLNPRGRTQPGGRLCPGAAGG